MPDETQTHEHTHLHDHDVARRQIEAFRRQKDKWMAESPDSPLEHEDRHTFAGLIYYPYDPGYRVPAVMERDPRPHVIQIQTTKDEWRHYTHYGQLRFEINGTPVALQVYHPLDEKGHTGPRQLFVPFRDRTAPRETYGAGRYLDLRALDDDTAYLLDFNRAYNPWCAYSPNFSCTLPPAENHLSVEIRAGEKNFSGH